MKRVFVTSIHISGYMPRRSDYQNAWGVYVSNIMLRAMLHSDEEIAQSLEAVRDRAKDEAKAIRQKVLDEEARIEAARPINRAKRFLGRMRIHHLN